MLLSMNYIVVVKDLAILRDQTLDFIIEFLIYRKSFTHSFELNFEHCLFILVLPDPARPFLIAVASLRRSVLRSFIISTYSSHPSQAHKVC